MANGPPTQEQLRAWFPRQRETPSNTFEIGLVLAGAVSAGAYTAGVLDYLFEALDAWHAARKADASLPQHDVVVRIMTGASAGGMNAAIAAAVLRRKYPHVHAESDDKVQSANPFYNAWVKRVGINAMLDRDDLRDGVASLLNSDPLGAIVRDTLMPSADLPAASHDWLVNPLPIILTVTNLRGVPYGVQFHGAGTVDHSMTLHRDYMLFAAEGLGGFPREPTAPSPDVVVLPSEMHAPAWELIGNAALATGAFPFGLKPRIVTRPVADYDFRHAYFDEMGNVKFGPPAWAPQSPNPYGFLAVDGGVMNNEPFDLAHDALAGVEGINPRDGLDARRAIIMIDPFVDPPSLGPDKPVSLLASGMALATAYQNQTRYSPGDWALLQSDTIYSRFLIAPSRNDELDGSAALTSGGLGAFLGFFSEDYRRHDFLLGRRNCQWFLKTVLTLPLGNHLFDTWSNDAKKEYVDARDPTHRQIVPVVGAVAGEELLPPWPAGKFELKPPLEAKLRKRIDAIAKALIKDGLAAWPPLVRLFIRLYLWLPQVLLRRFVFRKATDAIRAAIASVDARAAATAKPQQPPPPPVL